LIDFRPIFLVLGLLLSTLGVGMLLPALVDAASGNPDWRVFLASAAVSLFIGIALILTNRFGSSEINVRQAFLLTTLSWVVTAAFGALPFMFSDLGLTYTDAFFESMSGVTTTGSTVIVGLDDAPPGILLWRSLLQWMGGIGIIVMAVAVLPMLQVGGMQLFRMESADSSEKILPRAAQFAGAIGFLYLGLTIICAAALWIAGMSPFEGLAHAMTTIATGGFSTSDQSIGHFDNAAIDYILILFMIVGSLPFVLYLQVLRGHHRPLWHDSQVHWFLIIALGSVIGIALWRWNTGDEAFSEAFRYTSFNVVSIMTGTGYSTADYNQWGGIAIPAFFFLMFVGGCAGSTSCGVKIFRLQVLYAAINVQMHHLLQPHGVFIPRYNKKPIPDPVISSVMSFFFLFAVCYAGLALGLGALGLDFITATSGAATVIANVGPALGDVIGPAGTFADLPSSAKWLLSFGMLLGRLELFTVLVLFSPGFWRG
jgi:trk system potassium uptake protein TrkH